MLKEYLSEIANAIRLKLGTTEKINARNFAEKIMSIPQGGDDFWDIYQDNGTRTDYNGAFAGTRWTEDTFTPKYNIKPTDASNMFYGAKNLINLKQLINNAGIEFNTSQCETMNSIFQSADNITEIPLISTIGCVKISNLLSWHNWLVHVDKVILKPDGSQIITGSFSGLPALGYIRFEGKLGSTVDMGKNIKLTGESIVSIIEALYEGASGKTLSLSQYAVDHMSFPVTSEQSGITYNNWSELEGTKTNWNISLV